MPETTFIKIADLLIDTDNPRLQESSEGQREALRALARKQGRKLLALASHILEHGLNPGDHLYVMPLKPTDRRFVVLEGNRRLAALKALENPDLLADAVTPSVLKGFRGFSKAYQLAGPLDTVSCVVFTSRDEVQPWIVLRHDGELGGAGIVRWGSDDKARFRARMSQRKQRSTEIQTQVLDFLQGHGHLTAKERGEVPATSLKRLLQTPRLREKVGIEFRAGKLRALADDEAAIASALLFVANDLRSGNTKTRDIYHARDREKYANNLPASIVVTATKAAGQGVELEARPPATKIDTKTAKPKAAKPRDRLIPTDCVLAVNEPRLSDIEAELRRLSIEETPNAISVLFRVFVELSCDAYVVRTKMRTPEKASLGDKLKDVMTNLVQRQRLSSKQAEPVKRAYAKDSFLSPSITLMNQYVHNLNMSPISSDLRASWDSLQPFLTAIWTP